MDRVIQNGFEKSASIIDGRKIASEITSEVTNTARKMFRDHGLKPGLAVLLVGNDPASNIYVRNKSNMAKKCGFHSVQRVLEVDAPERKLEKIIKQWNNDPEINGILVQLPLPPHINRNTILKLIKPEKDIDGFHPLNVGLLNSGQLEEALIPCTALANLIIAKRAVPSGLKGLHVVMVGCSNIVGKPTAQLFLQANCTVTIAHFYTNDLPNVVRSADIVVVATGVPHLIKGSWIKHKAIVIDVGINRVPSHRMKNGAPSIVGDVEFNTAVFRASAITPVPGGVGPITIAMLMSNTLEAMLRQNNLNQNTHNWTED